MVFNAGIPPALQTPLLLPYCPFVQNPFPKPTPCLRAVASHGWAICTDIAPEHEMEKILYATDELTGLLGAVVLMYPSKSARDLNLKSVKKKYKDKRFAAGCSRDVIQRGADLLGWPLDDLLSRTIAAYQTFAPRAFS